MTDKTKLISLPPCFTKVNIFDNNNGYILVMKMMKLTLNKRHDELAVIEQLLQATAQKKYNVSGCKTGSLKNQ